MSQTQQNGWRAFKNYLIIFAAFVATLSPLFNVYEARANEVDELDEPIEATIDDEEITGTLLGLLDAPLEVKTDDEEAIGTDIADMFAMPMLAAIGLGEIGNQANVSNRGAERRDQNRKDESGPRTENNRRETNNRDNDNRFQKERPGKPTTPMCEIPGKEAFRADDEDNCVEDEIFVNVISVDYSTKKRARSVKVTITIEGRDADIEGWKCDNSEFEDATICSKRYTENVKEDVIITQDGRTSVQQEVKIRNIKKVNKNTPTVEITDFDETGIYGKACNAAFVNVSIRGLSISKPAEVTDIDEDDDCGYWSILFDEDVEFIAGKTYRATAQAVSENGKESRIARMSYTTEEAEPTCETDETLCEPKEEKKTEEPVYYEPFVYNPTAVSEDEPGDLNGDGTTDETEGEVEGDVTEVNWSLLNLISAIVAALMAVGASIRRMKDKVGMRVTAVLIGLASIVIFLATQDMTTSMIFADSWSILMVLLALANIAAVISLFRGNNEPTQAEDKTSK